MKLHREKKSFIPPAGEPSAGTSEVFLEVVSEKIISYTVLSASFEHPSQAFKNNYSLDGNSRDWAEFGWVSGRHLQALKSERFEIRTITFQRLHPGWNVKICSDFWLTVTLGSFLCFSKIDRTLRLWPGLNDVPRNSTNTKYGFNILFSDYKFFFLKSPRTIINIFVSVFSGWTRYRAAQCHVAQQVALRLN